MDQHTGVNLVGMRTARDRRTPRPILLHGKLSKAKEGSSATRLLRTDTGTASGQGGPVTA